MDANGWIWQVILPLFFVSVLAFMFWIVVKGAPRSFTPKVYLPRALTDAQERRITVLLLQGRRDWAIRAYASATGADEAESTHAIDHWDER